MARRPHILALGLLLVIFIGVNLFAAVFLRSARLDLTEQGLYTLSPGTHNILSRLKEPVTLKFYYSRDLAAAAAELANLCPARARPAGRDDQCRQWHD
jgi:ABC-type uncharacterized transport system involved in gliding motility auxiliary subunit